MQNEMEYFTNTNPWVNEETRHLFVNGLYINKDISTWRKYNIVLSTDGNEHVMQYSTLRRVLEIMPQSIDWNGKFALGIQLNIKKWKEELQAMLKQANDDKRMLKETICFLNFAKHNLTRDESKVYLDVEEKKKHLVDELLQNASLKLVYKETTKEIFTSSDPIRQLIIGCPPTKCDILVTRSEFLDAIPEACIKKYVKENGLIIHFGRLKLSKSCCVTLDATVLPNFNTHNNWIECFVEYISSLFDTGLAP